MGTRTKEIIREKGENVDLLSKDIGDYGSFLVFEYLGLNSEDVSILRKKLKKSDSKLVIYKNNILNRAFDKLQLKSEEKMKGANAILLTKNDIEPFQNIVALAKDRETIKLKLAYFENEIIEKDNLKLLASIGSKKDMLVKVSRTMMSPLYKFLYLLKNLPNK